MDLLCDGDVHAITGGLVREMNTMSIEGAERRMGLCELQQILHDAPGRLLLRFDVEMADRTPSCGATWQDYYCIDCKAIIKGEVHQDEDGNYYCSDCCHSPLCHIDLSDEPEPEWSLDDWCMCQGSSGHGPCPKCGKRMLPF